VKVAARDLHVADAFRIILNLAKQKIRPAKTRTVERATAGCRTEHSGEVCCQAAVDSCISLSGRSRSSHGSSRRMSSEEARANIIRSIQVAVAHRFGLSAEEIIRIEHRTRSGDEIGRYEDIESFEDGQREVVRGKYFGCSGRL
jgi:hypothetical protein